MFFIYKITNEVNKKIYIGQTCNTKRRWKGHIYAANCGKQTVLCRAFRKYGIENFTFVIIDNCKTLKRCIKLEKFYIKKYNSTNLNIGYNLHPGGLGAAVGELNPSKRPEVREKNRLAKIGTKHSEKTKQLMSLAHSGPKHVMFGKHHSKKAKKRMSLARIGRFGGKKHPMYGKYHTKSAIEANRKKHCKFIYKIIFPDGHKEIVNSLKQFARKYKLRSQSLFWCSNKKIPSYKGFQIEKLEKCSIQLN